VIENTFSDVAEFFVRKGNVQPNFVTRVNMKTIEELRSRIKELSKQAVELRRSASEVYSTNQEQAKLFRQQAREAIKRCEVLRHEIKRTQGIDHAA
jgi:RPA family protein